MNYLSYRFIFVLTLIVISINLYNIFWGTIGTIVLIFILYIFRKKDLFNKETDIIHSDKDLVAPVSGVITQIGKYGSTHFVEIKMGLFDCYTLFSPVVGRLELLDRVRGKKYWGIRKFRHDKNYNQNIFIFKQSNHSIVMKITKGFFTGKVVNYVFQQDILNIGAILGYVSFGGRVLLYLPESFTILVNKNDRIFGHKTLMAKNERSTK